jgi:sodium-dependent dicarboxylate transporter 2/3/5
VYLCRFVSPIRLGSISGGSHTIIQRELDDLGSMNRAEKIVAAVFCLTAFLWIFRKPIALGEFVIPGWSGLFGHPKFLHDSTVAMAMGILLMLIPVNGVKGLVINGKREWFALDWHTVQSKIPWGILLLFGGEFKGRLPIQCYVYTVFVIDVTHRVSVDITCSVVIISS